MQSMDGTGQKLDFDHWLALAKDRPAFELHRRTMINQVIEQAPVPQQERLRRLQWRIDQERRLSQSPMGACIRISRMMWEQMVGSGGLLDYLGAYGRNPAALQKMRRAKVIPLLRERDAQN